MKMIRKTIYFSKVFLNNNGKKQKWLIIYSNVGQTVVLELP